jgi:hypothetical protein
MKTASLTIAVAMAAAAAGPAARAGELQAETLSAWQVYLKQSDARTEERAGGRAPFFWMDESPERAARVRRGEVAIAPVAGHGTEAVPNGLVHHWIGAIFIPGGTVDALMGVVHDYDSYRRIYRPVVTSSRTLACADDRQEFQMVWQSKILFVRAAMQGHYRAYDVVLDRGRGYSVADAVEVREIADFGHPRQHLLPPDTGNGFIWRIRSVARFEERDGGLYLELEAMALTRDVPSSLAWMVNPVVNRLSVGSLTTTLRQTRDAVVSAGDTLPTLASCTNRTRASSFKPGGEE